MTIKEWFAMRTLGIATWILPNDHPAIRPIYDAAFTIDDPDWGDKRAKFEAAKILDALANDAPINGNRLAQCRVQMAAESLRA